MRHCLKQKADGSKYKQTTLCELGSVSDEYIEYNGEPEIEGESWEIDIGLVMESKYDTALRKYMESEDFSLMKEYRAMRDYTDKLRAKFESKPENPDDWFSEM